MLIVRVWLLAIAVALAGCQNGQKGEQQIPQPQPTVAELAASHNQRVSMLQTVHADGVIEITWRDDRGKHFEQGDMEFWIRNPSHTALRVTKLGDTYLWLGSDDQHYWLFDLFSEVKTLHVGRHDDGGLRSGGAFGAFQVQPRALLDLLGLTPIDEPADSTQPAAYDAEHKAWVAQSQGRGGQMRIYFDVQTRLPIRIESLSARGEAELLSTHRRYESVNMQGMLPVAFPKMAELIEISTLRGPEGNQGELEDGHVLIAINEAFGHAEEDTLANVFDFSRILQRHKPERVVGQLPEQRASAASAK